jgi:hypothetical protein
LGFETVIASEVKIERNIPPVGEYVFQLMPGAEERPNKFNGVTELNLSAAVAEGDHQGKRVFWTYPDPTAKNKKGEPLSFSSQAMKKLEIAIGVDSLPGETFPEYFRRVGAQNVRFGAEMLPNKYVKDGKEIEGDPKFGIFTVKAAA